MLGGELVLQLALILVNAVFACAEIALLSLNDGRLEKMAEGGNRAARRLLGLTREPAKFLATIQVGITLAGYLGSAFAADSFSGPLAAVFSAALAALGLGGKIPARALSTVAVVLITLILSFFTLVLGELVPKRVAMKKADVLAFGLASFLYGISRIFAPVVWLLTRATNGILRCLGVDPRSEEAEVTEEEIRLMIDLGNARGVIPSGEQEMIHNVFDFGGKTAGEVMTHRREVRLLRLEDDDAAWEREIIEGRHSLYPVCGKTSDDIAGILNARDYLCLRDRSRETALAQAVRPAQFVPTSAKADVLFHRMKKSRDHFAVVLDEHGGMMGIVTMSDLLEELVGDIAENEADAEAPAIVKRGAGIWQISGGAPLDKVARETGAPLPAADYDTFGGYVFTLLGRIPDDGETFDLEAEGLRISVVSVKDHRLERALVRRQGKKA